MRYTNCKCGNGNFEITRNSKITCTKCGQWQMPWSRLEFKVMKPNGRNWFFLVIPPHFIQALDDKFNGEIDPEDLDQPGINAQVEGSDFEKPKKD